MWAYVELTDAEVSEAEEAANNRNRMHRQVGRLDGAVVRNGMEADIKGCLGEMAVAKAFGLAWDGRFFEDTSWRKWRMNGHDVSGIEVRTTSHGHGRLILHPRDPERAPFVLVRSRNERRHIVVGWCFGGEGKRQEWWRDVGYGRPCFYVPESALRRLSELRGWLEAPSR